ncbi:MAG TPA: response regulator, partial [Candidatus Rifleibacterium sp.]|nr:response regulator [Candidatus Rifleibacterium sp.]
MDMKGIVHASSDLEHLFIGKDLSFRDYFKSASLGKPGVQIDIGVLTSTLGFYSSYPIYGPDSQVIGVCAVKRNLDDLDKTLRLYHPAMIIDATGTVFLSSDYSYLGRRVAITNSSARSISPLKDFPELQFPELEASRYLLGIEPLQTLNSKVLMLMESNVRNNQIWVLMVILLIVIIFVVILNGITRTAEAMRSLEVAQNRFKTLFDNAPESIFVVSLVTLKIIEANQSMLRQFQLTQSAIGMNYFDLMPTRKRNLTNSWHSASKKMFKHEREFRKQNGEVFSAEVTGAIMDFNRERALLLILHDITMHREIESRLREANALKGRFFANASHEIRTPMTAIIGLTELAASNCADDRQKHMLELIRSSSKSMLTLLNDIFDLAQIASGKLTINPVQFNLHLLLKDLVEIIQFQAEKKSVRIVLKINPDVPEMVISDPDRIRQILLNLLSNAIKFAHHGEVKLNASLQKTSQSACVIEFAVSDSRAGNSEQMQKNLFGAFVFNDPYVKDEKRDGSLGLSISKQLIDLMGGRIKVEANVEEGTTFKVSIPVTVKSVATAPLPEAPAEISLIRDGRRLNFLIADDNEINLFLASSIIEKFNGTAVCVSDGVEAITALKNNVFDAVLMDIQMPRMDGIAALKEIRKMTGSVAEIPVIAISAFASEQEKNMARDAGAQSYISKPYFPEDLLKAISELFATRNAETSEKPARIEEIIVKAPASGLRQINRSELELRVLKKPENILQINEIFQRRSGILQKDLEDCVSTCSCERLRETAHSIKGLAGMLAAPNAFELAREIEFLSRDGK